MRNILAAATWGAAFAAVMLLAAEPSARWQACANADPAYCAPERFRTRADCERVRATYAYGHEAVCMITAQ